MSGNNTSGVAGGALLVNGQNLQLAGHTVRTQHGEDCVFLGRVTPDLLWICAQSTQ
jgi:hypothetical protein